jgi:hypothetical protein
MTPMIRRVKILSIPTPNNLQLTYLGIMNEIYGRWEEGICTNTSWARLIWESWCIRTIARSSWSASPILFKTPKGQFTRLCRHLAVLWVTCEHSESLESLSDHYKCIYQALILIVSTYRSKSSSLRFSIVGWDVIYSHTTSCSFKELITHLRDTLVGTVSCTKVHDSSPVIRHVLGKRTASTGGSL